MARLVSALVIFLMGGSASVGAAATLHVDSDLGYACWADARRYHGGHFGLGAALGFGDLWKVRSRYGLSEHRSKGAAFTRHQIGLGPVIHLDVFEYVPWAALTPTVYIGHGDFQSQDPQFGISFDLGFDRLLDPNWSIGFATQFHQEFGQQRFPAYMLLGVRIGYRWSLGDPFEP